jgi:hypothetical protein
MMMMWKMSVKVTMLHRVEDLGEFILTGIERRRREAKQRKRPHPIHHSHPPIVTGRSPGHVP